jgi:nucleotide-binding universal stress UspA family protein
MQFVVCIDGRKSSFDALDHAATIADGLGGAVTLVHSINPQVQNSNGDIIQESADSAAETGHNLLKTAKKRLEGRGVSVETALLDNKDTVKGVVDFATAEDVDGIFIGHRALDEKHESLFGSFAKDLISASPIPVTVVSAAAYSNGQ